MHHWVLVVLLCTLQFWNEQNGCGWTPDGCRGSEAVASYVPWLKAWYTAMRAADPNAVLALGGENKARERERGTGVCLSCVVLTVVAMAA